MDSSIVTSTRKMRDSAEEIRQLAQQYNTCQQAVFESGRALDAMWEGDANSKFTSRMAADSPRFAELFQVIGQYCTAIVDSANEYDQTEAKVAEKMNTNIGRKSR